MIKETLIVEIHILCIKIETLNVIQTRKCLVLTRPGYKLKNPRAQTYMNANDSHLP